MRYQFYNGFLMISILVSIPFTGFGQTEAGKLQIGCVDNSVAYSNGFKGRDTERYPDQLQKILEDIYLCTALLNSVSVIGFFIRLRQQSGMRRSYLKQIIKILNR